MAPPCNFDANVGCFCGSANGTVSNHIDGSGIIMLVESSNSASVSGSPVALAQAIVTASNCVSPLSTLSLSLFLVEFFAHRPFEVSWVDP